MSEPLDTLLRDRATVRRLPQPAIRRALRKAAGLSQSEVASVLAINRASISRYESGARTPRGNVATRYVELLETLAEER